MPHSSPSGKPTPRFSLSVRAQLVVGSVAVLLLLLCAFGIGVRYIASATLMYGVDNDLRHQLVGVTSHPHGPPGGGPPPPFFGLGRDRRSGAFDHNGGNRAGEQPALEPPGDGPPGDGPLPSGTRSGGFNGGGWQPNSPPNPGGSNNGNGDPFRPDFDPRNDPSRQPQSGQARSATASAALINDPYAPRFFNAYGQPNEPEHRSLPPLDPNGLSAALKGYTVFSTVTINGQRVRVLSGPNVFERDPSRRGVVQTSYPLGGVDRALRSVDYALLMLIPLALICAGLGGWWITGRALRRIGQITRAAAAIGAQNLSDRLPATGSDEFSDLAQTFNGLLDRVDSAFQEQRRFTADASHELKTPLTVIQGTTSLALIMGQSATLDHAAIQEIDCAAASMAHLVQDLLYLARADAGPAQNENGEPTASAHRLELLLADPIERAVGIVAPRSRARVTFRQPGVPVCVNASEAELTRLFLNLLENAARYTPENGAITITATLEDSGKTAAATVADTGIGIAPEHLPRLTDRFYRVDDSRTRAAESTESGGSGLGLAICKSIAESHGGSLEITSEVGVGTTVTVRLPACVAEEIQELPA